LKVNPNLDSLRQVIPLLEHHLRDKGRSST
jgi:hypothetical protein